jgi:CDP-6-deoxy-D-xylo-4-hexulose-3-dehydrase
VDVGWNRRPTVVLAAIGLALWARRDEALASRRATAAAWSAACRRRPDAFAPVRFAGGASPFAFPLVLAPSSPLALADVVRAFEDAGVETRPVVAGNLARQPAMRRVPHRVAGPLAGADAIHDRGLYVGIHPGLSPDDVRHVAGVIESVGAGAGARR